MNVEELYRIALNTTSHIRLRQFGESGHVGCALITVVDNVYTGICVDVPTSIGMCAEQAAIAEMLKHGETEIKMIIAVYKDGAILPPCGKCREFIAQIDDGNIETTVVLPDMREVKLHELLPERWDEIWG